MKELNKLIEGIEFPITYDGKSFRDKKCRVISETLIAHALNNLQPKEGELRGDVMKILRGNERFVKGTYGAATADEFAEKLYWDKVDKIISLFAPPPLNNQQNPFRGSVQGGVGKRLYRTKKGGYCLVEQTTRIRARGMREKVVPRKEITTHHRPGNPMDIRAVRQSRNAANATGGRISKNKQRKTNNYDLSTLQKRHRRQPKGS